VEQGDPVTLFSGRLSTAEFFRQAAARLAPDGVLVSRLSIGSNAVVGERAALAGSVYRAVGEAFPFVRAAADPEGLIVAGKDPRAVTLDPAELAARFRARGIVSKVFVAGDFDALFPIERVEGVSARLAALASSSSASRDERPASLIRALAVRHRVIRSPIAPLLDRAARGRGAGVAALVLIPSLVVLGLVLSRRARGDDARGLAALHAVAAVGGAAMLWNLSVLFAFQTVAGALYGSLGLLTSAFMLGLAVGGALARKAGDATRGAAPRLLGSVIAAALVVAMLMPLALRAAMNSHGDARSLVPWALGGLLFLAGVVTGAVFPATAGVFLASGCEAIHAGGLTEAADHIGAAACALIGAALIIPTLGLWRASWMMAAVVGIAGLTVMLANPRRIRRRP
jgi:spermidine synthase